jgi:hypothetical protein
MIRLLLRQPGAGSSVVCFSKDAKVPVKVRKTLSSVGTSSSNTNVIAMIAGLTIVIKTINATIVLDATTRTQRAASPTKEG